MRASPEFRGCCGMLRSTACRVLPLRRAAQLAA
ncbi:hypothetical protein LMG28140_01397 [Paraburkholderia metrosideri]|uniref:Uncharacterized protein n=1 Tax=Paraburkholderia metrosideri TaxID=580937 RepID=A0ABM8NFI2_9BURK|nr:hypothetical protein LMG28140_01397 [Paraburkholderia metrosideri]